MSLEFEIPGRGRLEIEYVLCDVNGTLTDRGRLLDGVSSALERLRGRVEPLLVSADTFGTLEEIGRDLDVKTRRVRAGEEKRRLVEELGADITAVIGNGANDVCALEAAALGIAVLGPEEVSSEAARVADVLCRSVVEAFELLLDPRALTATLRR
jgi:P-type E1-E2 ATPase